MTVINYFVVNGELAFNRKQYNDICDEINTYLTDKGLTDIKNGTPEQQNVFNELEIIAKKLKNNVLLVIDDNHQSCGKLTLASFKLLLQDMKVTDVVFEELFCE